MCTIALRWKKRPGPLPKAQTPVIAQAPKPPRKTLWRDRPSARISAGAEGARSAAHRVALPNSQAKGQRGAPRAASHALQRIPVMSQTHKPSLRQLEQHDAFLERHIGPNDTEIAHMLRTIG